MISVEWDPKARDFLRKLQKDIAKRIFTKFEKDIKPNVTHHLETLVGVGGYKIRINDYRFFVDYYTDKDLLVVRAIRHRKDTDHFYCYNEGDHYSWAEF